METGDIFSEEEFISFQELVYYKFHTLSDSPSHQFLTLPWITKVLDAFFVCQEQFIEILCNYRANVSIPPLVSSITTGFLTNCSKSLDLCNNSLNALHKIRKCKKQLENLAIAVNSQQEHETRNALHEIWLLMEDNGVNSVPSHNQFFNGPHLTRHPNPNSAYQTLKFIACSRVQPGGRTGSNSAERLAATIFTMGFLLMFVMWVLIAALPCQDQTAEILFSSPRQFIWGKVLNIIQGRIVDESKKEERRNSKGLMKEIQEIEKSIELIKDFLNSENWPVRLEKKWIVNDRVCELLKIIQDCNQGLDTVELRLRYLFSAIWTCIIQGSDWFNFQSRRSVSKKKKSRRLVFNLISGVRD